LVRSTTVTVVERTKKEAAWAPDTDRTTYGAKPWVESPFFEAPLDSGSRRTGEEGNMKKLKETGASVVEYALLLSLIAVVCIGALQLTGNKSNSKLSSVGSSIKGASGPAPTTTTTACNGNCNGNNGNNGNGNGNGNGNNAGS
jgi:Flp pilus assembly pilin Flp